MIERFYLKNYLSFDEAELNLKKGLVVFTGPSGSGKSILMESILSSFGLTSCDASICESSVTWKIDEEEWGIENEDVNVFKQIKKEKARYFVNNQSLSKKSISALTSKHLRHLSLRDYSDFENDMLLDILDRRIGESALQLGETLQNVFKEFSDVEKELQILLDEEKRVTELKEFAKFEIEKIENIAPKSGEDAELLQIKKELSKKEKALQIIAQANGIFEFEHLVSSALELLDIESGFFDDTMNTLRGVLEESQERFSALDEVDVEAVLNRIEELGELKRRYGSIEEALEYKEQKLQELHKYENIEVQKEDLEKKYHSLHREVTSVSEELSALRQRHLKQFEQDLNGYLQELYLREAKLQLQPRSLHVKGIDTLNIQLQDTQLSKVSTGEFNRLRLAVLALKSEHMKENGGVLMLDEIDANLSGEESMSVARVLKKLTENFQIFVISHQPQLTSMGDQHFLVYKDGKISKTKELNKEERINEIARIISGEDISKEALSFAKELLKGEKQ